MVRYIPLLRRRSRNLDLIRGAGLSAGTVSQIGQTYGGLQTHTNAMRRIRRIEALRQQAQQGNKSAEASLADLGVSVGAKPGGGPLGGLKGFGGFLNRLLGTDGGLVDALAHLPGGAYQMGSSLWKDAKWGLKHPFEPANEPLFGLLGTDIAKRKGEFEKNIVDPTKEAYKWQYGPLFEGNLGETWKRFKQAPLGPVLDLLTIPSLGVTAAARAGGAVAKTGMRTGSPGMTNVGSRMASLGSVEGRTPLRLTTGLAPEKLRLGEVEAPEIGRLFDPSPNRRLMQKYMMDPLQSRLSESSSPAMRHLAEGSQNRQIRRMATHRQGQVQLEQSAAVSQAAKDLIPAIIEPSRSKILDAVARHLPGSRGQRMDIVSKGLTPEEQSALILRKAGLTPQPTNTGVPLIERAQELWQQSIKGENPEGFNIEDFAGVPIQQAQKLANLPPEVVALINEPTEQMLRASQLWDESVATGQDRLDITPEEHQAKIWAVQSRLRGGKKPAELEKEFDDWANSASGGHPDRVIRPNYVPFVPATNLEYGPTGMGKVTGKGESELQGRGKRRTSPQAAAAEEIFKPPRQVYLQEDELKAFTAGAFRDDTRVMLAHVAQREQDILEMAEHNRAIGQLSLKDPETGESATFKTQAEVDKMAMGNHPGAQRGDWQLVHPDMPIQWFRVETNHLEQVIKALDEMPENADLDPNILPKLNELMDNSARQFVQEHLGAMKTEGIAMPKSWADQVVQHSKIRDPYHPAVEKYVAVMNKWRTWTLVYMPRWWVNTFVGSFMVTILRGNMDPRAWAQASKMMSRGTIPPGIGIGSSVSHELREAGRGGYAGSRAMTRRIAETVQRVEDYFRTVSALSSLDRSAKQHIREVAGVVENHRSAMKGVLDDEYVQWLMDNPHFMETAMTEVNRYHYNFMQLGPRERRVVRQIIPFYGWYKFITTLAWRLPVEYPGRTNVITKLGQIGIDEEEELGYMPEWMKGAIFWNKKNPKDIKYISTFGLNPFAQFATPFGPEGEVAGVIRPGMVGPVGQAALAGLGIDPMTGSGSSFAPDAGIARDFFGGLIDVDRKRELESAGAKRGGMRALGTFLRSFPQVRIGEIAQMGGRPSYPESIPLLNPRPINVREKTRRDVSPLGILRTYAGVQSRTKDLPAEQSLFEKRLDYAETLSKNQRKKYRKFLQEMNSGQ